MSDTVGSVAVEVVPDARGWSQKLQAQLRDQKVEIKADADTTEAEAQLDEAARTRTAKIKTDTSDLSKGASKLDSFVSNLGLIPTLALTAGSALIPLGAALAGVTAALAAPLVIGGGGATLFALLGGIAVHRTNEQLKNIDALQKKLSGLTKGTAEYAAVSKQLAAQQAALSPAQQRLAAAQGSLSSSFDKLMSGHLGNALLGPIAQGMTILSNVLPQLAPVITAVSGALTTLLDGVSDATKTRGFSSFISQVARLAGSNIVAAGRIAGNLAEGVGGLLIQIDKHLSGSVLDGLERFTGAFAKFGDNAGHSKALRDFFDYFHKIGPQVGDTFEAVARAVVRIGEALAPLGPSVLKGIQLAANALSRIPLPILTALAGATAGLVGFGKFGGFKGVNFLLGNGGVQKVFVVNPGFSGGEGEVGRLAPFLAVLPEILTVLGAGIGVYLITKHVALPNIKNAAIDSVLNRVSPTVGGPNNPNSPNYTTRQATPGTRYYNANTGHFYTGGSLSDPTIGRATTAYAGLRAAVAAASRAEDLIGPHAVTAAGVANRAIGSVAAHLADLHDRKFTIIAQTQNAIESLERVQNFRLQDKDLSIYAHYYGLERGLGPGGGAGRPSPNNGGSGSGHGASGSAQHIYIHPDDRTSFRAYIQNNADDVYHANQRYDDARHGR